MEFIRDNYVWMIVAAIVIIMAIIGYFADKTDFGRKKIEKVKQPKEKKQKQPEKIEVDAKGISELTQDMTEKYAMEESTTEQEDLPVLEPLQENEDLSTPELSQKDEEIDPSLYTPLEDTDNHVEDSAPVEDIPVAIPNDLENSLYPEQKVEESELELTPLTPIEEPIAEESMDKEEPTVDNLEPIEDTVVKLDETTDAALEDLANNAEDDIWKF